MFENVEEKVQLKRTQNNIIVILELKNDINLEKRNKQSYFW